MKKTRMNLIRGALLLSSTALFACLGNEPDQGSNPAPSPNISDTRKDNYRPATPGEEAAFKAKRAMMRKIDAEWADHLEKSGTSQYALQKTATTGTIGILGSIWTGSNSTLLDVFMDTENDGNADILGYEYPSPYNHPWIVGMSRTTDNHGGVMFNFTRQTVSSLPILKYDYIVLRLSDDCPTNGIPFGEVFDNEDTDNQDYTLHTSVYPGWSNRSWTGTRLEFCLVPGNGTTTNVQLPWYVAGHQSAVFGAHPGNDYSTSAQSVCTYTDTATLDGEDTGFDGHFEWEGMSSTNQAKVNAIMDIRNGAPHFLTSVCNVPVGVP